MSHFRFVAIGTDRIEQKPRLGPAIYLHEFLVDHQTDAVGNVYYGKPFGYSWIRSRWANCPPIRTLKRHMQTLRRLGKVRVIVLPFGQGMRVRLLDSVKWANVVPDPAIQLPLLTRAVTQIRRATPVEKPVNKQRKSDLASELPVGPSVAPVGGHSWPPKEVKKLIEETIKDHTVPSLPEPLTEDEFQQRRKLLKAQADRILKKYKTAG